MSRLMNFEKNKENQKLVQENYLRLELMEKIYEIMKRKGITQAVLAKKMEVSKSEISRLLTDDRNLRISTITKIFNALGEELSLLTKTELEKITHKEESVVVVVKSWTEPYMAQVQNGYLTPISIPNLNKSKKLLVA